MNPITKETIAAIAEEMNRQDISAAYSAFILVQIQTEEQGREILATMQEPRPEAAPC